MLPMREDQMIPTEKRVIALSVNFDFIRVYADPENLQNPELS